MRTTALLLAAALAAPLAAQSTLEQGRAALNRNDPDTAVNLLEKAVEQAPNNAEGHYLLGAAYGRQAQSASMFKAPGLAGKAHEQLDRAVQLDPNYVEPRMALVEYFMTVPGFLGGDQQKALEQAREIKKRDSLTGHRAFAFIYSRQKKLDLARKEYLDAVNEQPDSPASHYWLGVFFLGEKNYKSAGDEFETSLRLDPKYMPTWFRIGQLAALSGANLQRGEEALQKYLVYTPKHNEPPLYRAHFWLGGVYEKLGRKAEARQSYATSLRLNPNQKDVSEALKRVS